MAKFFFFEYIVSLFYKHVFTKPKDQYGKPTQLGVTFASGYLAFMLVMYPICWALSEGANVISPSSEMIWYGILDILAGPVFLFFFLWELRGVDYHTFGLHSGKFVAHETAPVREKAAPAPAAEPAAPTGEQAA